MTGNTSLGLDGFLIPQGLSTGLGYTTLFTPAHSPCLSSSKASPLSHHLPPVNPINPHPQPSSHPQVDESQENTVYKKSQRTTKKPPDCFWRRVRPRRRHFERCYEWLFQVEFVLTHSKGVGIISLISS
ncbi:hypothetical protein Moror_7112 [Moniliophthora roreri MCA 2997]|uniref:Uncharacterized protein n=1 Tax=Moniliophthora roreri (strain MCA 2997) TaxID=1381753 RepID=V2XTZ5_MONRO|nr:hypothetical protein Moror_7112 [Moniliophthora roreri MCA 2997]